jgi:hypothetical protein
MTDLLIILLAALFFASCLGMLSFIQRLMEE